MSTEAQTADTPDILEIYQSAWLTTILLLQASKQQAQHKSTRNQGNLSDSITAIARLEGEAAKAEDKYTFLQEVRTYIADLCDMLQVGHQPLQNGIWALGML